MRLSESVAKSLSTEAAEQGTTVNSLVNRILNQHYGWGKRAREIGLVSINKAIFTKLIEKADEETLVRLGQEEVLSTWKEMAEFWLHGSTPGRMLELLRIRERLDSKTESKVMRDGDAYTIMFRNDYGPKYSIVAESAILEFVRKSFHVEPRISRGDSLVTAHFKVHLQNPPI